MPLLKTVNSYLFTIHWIWWTPFIKMRGGKKKKKKTRDDPFLTVRILSLPLSSCVFISPHCSCDFLVQFLVGVATGLARARSAQTQAKSSAEHQESNRHQFVLSPSGSQTTADSINCFPGLWQLSVPQQRNTLKLNTGQFSFLNTEAFSYLLCTRVIVVSFVI